MSDTTNPKPAEAATDPIESTAVAAVETIMKIDPVPESTNVEQKQESPSPVTPAKQTAAAKKATAPKTPKTPKGKAEPKTPKTPKVAKEPKTPKSSAKKRSAEDGTDAPLSTKKAKGEKGTTPGRKTIPTSDDKLTPEDKMMLEWKDAGKSWKVITAEWARMTGEEMGTSSLPNRYSRIKAALSAVKPEHLEPLKRAIREVERKIEDEHQEAAKRFEAERKKAKEGMFKRVAEQLVADHGEDAKYNAGIIKNCYDKIKAAEAAAASASVPAPAPADSARASLEAEDVKGGVKAESDAEEAVDAGYGEAGEDEDV